MEDQTRKSFVPYSKQILLKQYHGEKPPPEPVNFAHSHIKPSDNAINNIIIATFPICIPEY